MKNEQVIDAQIATLQYAYASAQHALERSATYVHVSAGDKQERINARTSIWKMALTTALQHCTPEARESYEMSRDALTNVARELDAEEAKYTGWSRFFLVRNANGHIHSSMHCSTCTRTTDFAWLTDISSLTEAEAVAVHGERLCTVCFPSAPVEMCEGYFRKSKEQAAAAREERAVTKAAKEEKRAAYWEPRHYAVKFTRESDGETFIHGWHNEWESTKRGERPHGTTLKAATRDAAAYDGYNGKHVVIDLLTMEEVK